VKSQSLTFQTATRQKEILYTRITSKHNRPKFHICCRYTQFSLSFFGRFVRSELDQDSTWEQRVAKKYYDKLFKEYAICELKYYKEGKIALRWRTEKEVMAGKGQFICASTRCESTTALKSWEVNFGYMEDGEKKNELVKVRLCEGCSDKLNYKTKKRLAQTLKRKRKEEKESRRYKKSGKGSDKSSSSAASSHSSKIIQSKS
jgi:protein FRA10AC1